MRIGIGQLWQETNSFNPLSTTRKDFEEFGILRGAALVARMADTNELGGFVQSLRRWPEHPQIVGLVRLPAWPGGPATSETFSWLSNELIAAIESAMPLDGLLLALHGSLVAVDHPDVEGEILTAVRRVVGPAVPIVATLDLHAHLTPAMVEGADALVLYHTVPHVDIFETGERAAAVLRRILVHQQRPVSAFEKIPMVVPAERANTEQGSGLSYELKQQFKRLEGMPGVISAGIATVQPWLDVPDLGVGVLVVANDDCALAREACAKIADEVWKRRQEYMPKLVPYQEAIGTAHKTSEGLVVLGDGADATTAGAPGDNTSILAELLKYDWPRHALTACVSPEVVHEAERLGAGAAIVTEIGGRRDHRFSKPVLVQGTIERLFDARFVLDGHLAHNLSVDMGRSAVLRLGDVRLIATSRTGPHFAPELFQSAGIDPFNVNVVVAKSPCGFRAAYERHAARIVHLASPGCAPSDFWNYPYQRITRPLWPWDTIDDWHPTPRVFRRN